MFKKTLIAIALSTAAMSASAANVIDTTNLKNAAHVISLQSLTAAKTTTVPAVKVTLDADFETVIIDGAKVVITVSGAVFNSGITSDLTGDVVAAGTPVNAGNSLTYTIDSNTFTADDDEFTIPALPVILDALDSTVKYTVSFTTSGGSTISGATAASTSVANIVNEWSVTFGVLNNQIDVADNRETFVGGGSTDTLELKFSDIDTVGGAALVSAAVTVKGDFTDVVSVADGLANAYTINTDKDEATFTYNGATTPALSATDLNSIDETLTLTVKSGTDAVSLTENVFTASVSVMYDTSKTLALATDTAAGSWTLNSSSTTVNYAPMGPNTQLIVNATSAFKEDASVDVSYLAADGTMELLEDVATVSAKSVTKLGDTISAAVLGDMGTTSAKTKLVVSVNAPDGNVTFFTGFKDITDGSRMALQQVDSVANSTLAAVEANKTTLGTSTTGIVKAIADSGVASSTAALQIAALNVATETNGATGAYVAGEVATANLICAQINATFTLKATGGGAVAANNVATDSCQL
jgi:hypothetical protein